MVFSERDIDLLRLLCWCQYLPPEAACQICPEAEVQLLRSMGLVRQHRTSGALLLTTQGAEWLGGICPGGVPAFSRSYHKSAIQRRLRISRLALTAYRAGVHIFTTSTEELSASPALFFSSITRSRGSNPWGSTRVAALAHLGELLCSIHYVCPGIGKIALTDELTAFNNQTAAFRGLRRVMVFAGESYASVLSELEAVYPHGDTKLIPYGEAYRRLRLPVHLLSCDDTGAIQLQILATPGYRPRLTQAALKSQYVPPPEGAPALDAMFQGLPFVPVPPTQKQPFTDDEVNTVWKYQNEPWVDSVLVFLYSGWRISELLSMKKSDVDLHAGTMKGGTKTKAGKDRVVPIHSKIRPLVESRLAEGGRNARACYHV